MGLLGEGVLAAGFPGGGGWRRACLAEDTHAAGQQQGGLQQTPAPRNAWSVPCTVKSASMTTTFYRHALQKRSWSCGLCLLLVCFCKYGKYFFAGTPLQNDLMELWSLMHFLMPQVFASHAQFKDWFSNPLTGMVEGSAEVSKRPPSGRCLQAMPT